MGRLVHPQGMNCSTVEINNMPVSEILFWVKQMDKINKELRRNG